jgi:small subunit ribosomal protein S6
MRRYELMLVLRPDLPDDKTQAVLDRTTRGIAAGGGQIIKVAPWGRRRLAFPIDRHREGSYHILIFEAPAEAIAELERSLLITEEVLRHLVTRVERPVRSLRRDGSGDESADGSLDIAAPPPDVDVDDEDEGERIDESESEAAPAAIE